MRLVTRNSPNQSARIHTDQAVRLVICHTPEGSYESAIATCLDPAYEVSYHRLYKKDGTEATQLVPFDRKAWHARAMNGLSDGLAVEGHARSFDLADLGTRELARGVAERLVVRKLPCEWTTDPAKGGFCRHGDLQHDRIDPTPDLTEWRLFVAMVTEEHRQRSAPVQWPQPIPEWFWPWARWWLGEGEYSTHGARRGPRPTVAPQRIPLWAWRRLAALLSARRK